MPYGYTATASGWITQSQRGYRRGKPAKKRGQDIEQGHCLEALSAHTPRLAYRSDRDFFVDEVLKDYLNTESLSRSRKTPKARSSMYTSGTTGKPKGGQHRTGVTSLTSPHRQVLPRHSS